MSIPRSRFRVAAVAFVFLVQGCVANAAPDAQVQETTVAIPTPQSATAIPINTATVVPTPVPTLQAAIPTPEPTPTPTATVSPLDDCTGDLSLDKTDAEHLVLISTEDSITAFTPEGQIIGAIPCKQGAGHITEIDPNWHLLAIKASYEATNVAFLRLHPELLSVTDVIDSHGVIRRPYWAPMMSRAGQLATASEHAHEPALFDLTSRQMDVPDELFDISTSRMEVALGGAVVVASTDTGVWLIDSTDSDDPRKIAARGPARVNTAGTHAWLSTFAEDGLNLAAYDLLSGEQATSVPLMGFVRFDVLGENALLQTDAGVRIITVDGIVGPQLLGPGFALHSSDLATDYVFAHQTMPGTANPSVIIAADGSLTPLPALDGLKATQHFRVPARRVFVDSEAGVVTMIDLSDASVDTWQLRPGIPFHLVELLDGGAVVALNFTFDYATVLLFENDPTPLQLPGATQILADVDAGLALLVEGGFTSIRSIPDGTTIALVDPGFAIAIVERPRP